MPKPAKPGRKRSTAARASRSAGQDATALLLELLAIPGPSGQERAISERVQAKLRDAGAAAGQIRSDRAHVRSSAGGETGNLILTLPGTKPGPRRMLVAHLDTVPLCVGCQPVKKGRLIRSRTPTGLGADNRAGTAVLVWVAQQLLKRQLPYPPLTFLWTVQEEIGLQGARLLSISALKRPRLAFNWDGGSAAKLTIGATGGYRTRIDVYGQASHAGGAPERGVSAIAAAALAVARLHDSGWHGAISKDQHLGTANIGVFNGGTATNVVADHVQLLAEARSHDPRFRKRIVRETEKIFRQAAQQVRNVDGKTARVTFDGRLDYEAFCLPTSHQGVAVTQAAVEAAGRQPELAVANGGLDANWLDADGIPTVSLGCGQRAQHTVEEALDLDEFASACQVALILATDDPSVAI